MARLYAVGMLLVVACSLLATAQGRAVTDLPANFSAPQPFQSVMFQLLHRGLKKLASRASLVHIRAVASP